jgi:hypothetical protein
MRTTDTAHIIGSPFIHWWQNEKACYAVHSRRNHSSGADKKTTKSTVRATDSAAAAAASNDPVYAAETAKDGAAAAAAPVPAVPLKAWNLSKPHERSRRCFKAARLFKPFWALFVAALGAVDDAGLPLGNNALFAIFLQPLPPPVSATAAARGRSGIGYTRSRKERRQHANAASGRGGKTRASHGLEFD